MCFHVDHLIKRSCLGASYSKLAPCLVWYRYIFCRQRYVFICHVTPQDYSVEMSCIYMGETSLQHVITLKSLVIIGILIVKKKKCFIKSTNLKNMCATTENLSYWITTRQEKNVTISKMYILRKSSRKLKKIFFP